MRCYGHGLRCSGIEGRSTQPREAGRRRYQAVAYAARRRRFDRRLSTPLSMLFTRRLLSSSFARLLMILRFSNWYAYFAARFISFHLRLWCHYALSYWFFRCRFSMSPDAHLFSSCRSFEWYCFRDDFFFFSLFSLIAPRLLMPFVYYAAILMFCRVMFRLATFSPFFFFSFDTGPFFSLFFRHFLLSFDAPILMRLFWFCYFTMPMPDMLTMPDDIFASFILIWCSFIFHLPRHCFRRHTSLMRSFRDIFATIFFFDLFFALLFAAIVDAFSRFILIHDHAAAFVVTQFSPAIADFWCHVEDTFFAFRDRYATICVAYFFFFDDDIHADDFSPIWLFRVFIATTLADVAFHRVCQFCIFFAFLSLLFSVTPAWLLWYCLMFFISFRLIIFTTIIFRYFHFFLHTDVVFDFLMRCHAFSFFFACFRHAEVAILRCFDADADFHVTSISWWCRWRFFRVVVFLPSFFRHVDATPAPLRNDMRLIHAALLLFFFGATTSMLRDDVDVATMRRCRLAMRAKRALRKMLFYFIDDTRRYFTQQHGAQKPAAHHMMRTVCRSIRYSIYFMSMMLRRSSASALMRCWFSIRFDICFADWYRYYYHAIFSPFSLILFIFFLWYFDAFSRWLSFFHFTDALFDAFFFADIIFRACRH